MKTYYNEIPSPFGPLATAVDDSGAVVAVWFGQPDQNFLRHFPGEPNAEKTAEVDRQLEEYFQKRRTSFDLRFAPKGSPFQKEVWAKLLEIPYGETRSYGQLAKELGQPNASRAVGRANATNPVAIIVPCHRVIGANGTLTGYAGGLDMKQKLLSFERGEASLFD